MGTALQRRPTPPIQFVRTKNSKTKPEAADLVGPAPEKRSAQSRIGWREEKHSTTYGQLWRMDLQEVLAKTIAMIRGSQEYQEYQRRCRKFRSRGNRQDKYHQAMNYEYQGQK